MAEYIKKDTIEKFIKDGLNNPDKSKAFGHDAIEILEEIHFAPAADVEEVVRCKDCKHREIQNGCDSLYCRLLDIAMGKNDFCSYGERREENV